MKFATSLAVLAAGVVATKHHARDLAQVEDVINKVLDGLKTYDGEITKFTGGDPSDLFAATSTMIGIVKTAVDGTNDVTPVSIDEAQQFKPLSDEMNAAGDSVLTDLDAKVATFEQEHLCAAFYEDITELGDNVVALMNAIASKFPSANASAAEIQHFTDTFAALEAKLKSCSDVNVVSATVTDCPTGGASPWPTTFATATAAGSFMGTAGYTAAHATWTASPVASGWANNTAVATARPTFVTAGASGLKLSAGAVAVAAFVAFML